MSGLTEDILCKKENYICEDEDFIKMVAEEAIRLKRDFGLDLYSSIDKAKEIYKEQLSDERRAKDAKGILCNNTCECTL